MLKRTFVGIPIAKNLSRQILDWAAKRQQPAFRWIAPKNLHITLAPPWNESNIGNIIAKLQNVKAPSFEIVFNGITLGPGENMIWLVGTPPKEVLDLRLKIYEALGAKPDERPFKLHLTLARSKNTGLPYINEKVEWKIKAEKFVLYESRLLPEGADYEILESFPLN